MGANRSVYSYLFKTYGRRPGYWVGIVATILQTLLLRVVSVLVLASLAGNIAGGNFTAARHAIVWYVVVGVLGFGLRLLKEIAAVRAENIEYGDLMVMYYQKLVGKDMSFFRDNQTGYLASTFRQHIDSIMDFARLLRGELIQTPISLVVPTVVLFIASWRVGLAALGVIIAQICYITWTSSTTNYWRARSHKAYKEVSGAVSDDVTNIVAYKTSGLAASALKRLERLRDEELEAYAQRRQRLAMLDMPRELVTVLGMAVAFWLIISGAQSASQSVGLVVLTVTYMFQIFNNVATLPDLIIKHDDLVSKLYPTLEYITDKYQTIKDPERPKLLKINKAAIDIDDVTFGYPDGRGGVIPVFKGLSLHIKGGEQIGIVGLSGSGKSTLASLLMRFDEISGGSIKIDGTDIRDVRQADLRKHIAYVPQEPLLFHRTIKENLQYFGKAGSSARMIAAAKAAHADGFISALPHGYDTMVGERGVKLSGGQKQRVVIARAILKNAPIMLFDEATSALDSESEKIIQKALPEIIGKRTAIVIAHRLSTIAGLDRIIVMHDGKIIEDGTHAELLERKGRYYSLWQKQTAQEA